DGDPVIVEGAAVRQHYVSRLILREVIQRRSKTVDTTSMTITRKTVKRNREKTIAITVGHFHHFLQACRGNYFSVEQCCCKSQQVTGSGYHSACAGWY